MKLWSLWPSNAVFCSSSSELPHDYRKLQEALQGVIDGGMNKPTDKVEVLGRLLRGKTDLRGLPYPPTTWIFTDLVNVGGQ